MVILYLHAFLTRLYSVPNFLTVYTTLEAQEWPTVSILVRAATRAPSGPKVPRQAPCRAAPRSHPASTSHNVPTSQPDKHPSTSPTSLTWLHPSEHGDNRGEGYPDQHDHADVTTIGSNRPTPLPSLGQSQPRPSCFLEEAYPGYDVRICESPAAYLPLN